MGRDSIMPQHSAISSPGDASLDELCLRLVEAAAEPDYDSQWPSRQLAWCGKQGVYRWFLSPQWGGLGWSDRDIVRGYLSLSAACLTTTFIITQRTGACRRIAASDNQPLQQQLLPALVSGDTFATLGISHLTTSRRHLRDPVLRAEERADSFILDGYSPWVTGGEHAKVIVTGATLPDRRQILVALPTDSDGVEPAEPAKLVALSASGTGAVHCRRVRVDSRWLLDGPVENIMRRGTGAKTGGLQTSTLAVGLASAAIAFLNREAAKRPELMEVTERLQQQHTALETTLLDTAAGEPTCSHEELRARANSMVLRATQSALAAAKGAGYVLGHPTGRWCREALFFLVWSCPQPVMEAALCELAGISD